MYIYIQFVVYFPSCIFFCTLDIDDFSSFIQGVPCLKKMYLRYKQHAGKIIDIRAKDKKFLTITDTCGKYLSLLK